jgi:hypothetical protein
MKTSTENKLSPTQTKFYSKFYPYHLDTFALAAQRMDSSTSFLLADTTLMVTGSSAASAARSAINNSCKNRKIKTCKSNQNFIAPPLMQTLKR